MRINAGTVKAKQEACDAWDEPERSGRWVGAVQSDEREGLTEVWNRWQA